MKLEGLKFRSKANGEVFTITNVFDEDGLTYVKVLHPKSGYTTNIIKDFFIYGYMKHMEVIEGGR